jgi:hypothetical protein
MISGWALVSVVEVTAPTRRRKRIAQKPIFNDAALFRGLPIPTHRG